MIVKINNWNKHNRSDVKHPTWFACSNEMVEDDDFIGFTGEEFRAWIYLLSKASKKQNPNVSVNFDSAFRKANIKETSFRSAIKKLQELQIIAVDVTSTLRERYVDVSLQDSTLHNNTEMGQPKGLPVEWAFEEVYAAYPKRVGNQRKADGMKSLKKIITSQKVFDEIKTAVENYASHCRVEKIIGTERVAQFATFFGTGKLWEEWINRDEFKPKKLKTYEDLKREEAAARRDT